MTGKKGFTPPALDTFLSDDLDNFIAAATPGGIEAQEFVNSTTLPIKFNFATQEQFEKMGIVFGDRPVGNDLFCEAVLPEGWHKEATAHSMWSDLVDDQGRRRASIFYKAAFYDRNAFMDITPRFIISVDPVVGWDNYKHDAPDIMWHCVVEDCDNPIWTSDPVGPELPYPNRNSADYEDERKMWLAWLDRKNELEELGQAWLDEKYPEWRDPTTYW